MVDRPTALRQARLADINDTTPRIAIGDGLSFSAI